MLWHRKFEERSACHSRVSVSIRFEGSENIYVLAKVWLVGNRALGWGASVET